MEDLLSHVRRGTAEGRAVKAKNLLNLPFVEVTWRDSTSHHGWTTLATAKTRALTEVKTVGYLVRRDKQVCSLAQSIARDGELCEVWTIPTGSVQRIRRVRRVRRGLA